MKLSTIFRRAARRIERGQHRFSCVAVSCASRDAGFGYWGPARATYQRLISPFPDGTLTVGDFGFSPAARNHRILALCMAATLADEEGL